VVLPVVQGAVPLQFLLGIILVLNIHASVTVIISDLELVELLGKRRFLPFSLVDLLRNFGLPLQEVVNGHLLLRPSLVPRKGWRCRVRLEPVESQVVRARMILQLSLWSAYFLFRIYLQVDLPVFHFKNLRNRMDFRLESRLSFAFYLS